MLTEALLFGILTWNDNLSLSFSFVPPSFWTWEMLAHAWSCAGQCTTSPRTEIHTWENTKKRAYQARVYMTKTSKLTRKEALWEDPWDDIERYRVRVNRETMAGQGWGEGEVRVRRCMRQKYSPLIWYQFMTSIFSAEWKMPARMVGLLGTLCPSQNIYLIDHYCFRKVVPKVPRTLDKQGNYIIDRPLLGHIQVQ